MKNHVFITTFCLVLLSTNSKAAEKACPYEETPVCALPLRCGQAEFGEGKVPFECEVGISYTTRCKVKPERETYLHEGKCEKPRPISMVKLIMKDGETCAKPIVSGAKVVEIVKAAGLKPPARGSILAEYSEGSYYPDKPLPGCLWIVRVALVKGLSQDRIEFGKEVFFVDPNTGEVLTPGSKKSKSPKKKK